jgi:hypothetical protein
MDAFYMHHMLNKLLVENTFGREFTAIFLVSFLPPGHQPTQS